MSSSSKRFFISACCPHAVCTCQRHTGQVSVPCQCSRGNKPQVKPSSHSGCHATRQPTDLAGNEQKRQIRENCLFFRGVEQDGKKKKLLRVSVLCWLRGGRRWRRTQPRDDPFSEQGSDKLPRQPPAPDLPDRLELAQNESRRLRERGRLEERGVCACVCVCVCVCGWAGVLPEILTTVRLWTRGLWSYSIGSLQRDDLLIVRPSETISPSWTDNTHTHTHTGTVHSHIDEVFKFPGGAVWQSTLYKHTNTGSVNETGYFEVTVDAFRAILSAVI